MSMAGPKILKVVLFLAPLCPICQNMSFDLRLLEAEFADDPVEFIGVFPNASTQPAQIEAFRQEYGLSMEMMQDTVGWTEALDAHWTPEAFVLDARDSVLYQGRINDRYFAPGRRRNKTRNRDLREAIASSLKGAAVAVPKTDAVGCPIEGMSLAPAKQ